MAVHGAVLRTRSVRAGNDGARLGNHRETGQTCHSVMKQTAKDRKEFAAYVRGDHPDVESFRRYVLAELRCAVQRARYVTKKIEAIGTALNTRVIGPELALAWMNENHLEDFVIPSEPPWQRLEELATVAVDRGGAVDAKESQTPTGD